MVSNQWLLALAKRHYRFISSGINRSIENALDKRYARFKYYFDIKADFEFRFNTHPFIVEMLHLMTDRFKSGNPISNVFVLLPDIQKKHKALANQEAQLEKWQNNTLADQPTIADVLNIEHIELASIEDNPSLHPDPIRRKHIKEYLRQVAHYMQGNLPRYSLLNDWMEETEPSRFVKLFLRFIAYQTLLNSLNSTDQFSEYTYADFEKLAGAKELNPEIFADVSLTSREPAKEDEGVVSKKMNRLKHDGLTLLSLEQTALLGNLLRQYRIIIPHKYLNNAELAKGLSILTHFSEHTLRQSISQLDASRKNYSKLQEALKIILKRIEEELDDEDPDTL